ncbi:hypothetical protein [Alcaligenes sp. SDU_A2]|uniref:hypothetical protein n=1 Tax=Alcaligenes sp. SDU_A2 TaxID=3136634 RepID=UPI00311DCAB9
MKRTLHATAALLSVLCIAVFWTSTLLAELFASPYTVACVKQWIAWALLGFVPLIMLTGATGWAMGGRSSDPRIRAKRRRMPLIAALGMLILAPSAVFLSLRAQANLFDPLFYSVQALELVAGAINMALIVLNVRDGLRMRTPLAQRT